MRGGKREGAGRPLGSKGASPKRDTIKQIRWTAEEWSEVVKQAALGDEAPSAYIRNKVLEGE